jgi:phosphoribosylglycinamide formyltransferase-1
MPPLRLCVLISGSGSNLQALIEARDCGRLDIDFVQVISNVADAKGLERARRAGISCSILEHGAFEKRKDFDRALALLMAAGEPQLFVFAGFMRVVGEAVLVHHNGRMINLHPSLLPLYPGLNTYQRAIDAGDREHGASVHFLTEELDGGPVISQLRIPILPSDDKESLQQRLAPQEHRLIVATVELFQQHNVECRDSRVVINKSPIGAPLLLGDDGKLTSE